ncbi:MAG: hypothetical protein K0S58_2558 [Nitrospira sp.]|jgi:hypothetical protein|nr:hypothetical protein [Nitrospira sp.]
MSAQDYAALIDGLKRTYPQAVYRGVLIARAGDTYPDGGSVG